MSRTFSSSQAQDAPSEKPTSQSSDYFDDDPEFSNALATLEESVLFGSQPLNCIDNVPNESTESTGEPEIPAVSQGRKRKRSPAFALGRENSQEDIFLSPFGTEHYTSTLRSTTSIAAETPAKSPDVYSASKFGGFGDYRRRKIAKLQIQNTSFSSQDNSSSQIFKSLAIYVSFKAPNGIVINMILGYGTYEPIITSATSPDSPTRRSISCVLRPQRHYVCAREGRSAHIFIVMCFKPLPLLAPTLSRATSPLRKRSNSKT